MPTGHTQTEPHARLPERPITQSARAALWTLTDAFAVPSVLYVFAVSTTIATLIALVVGTISSSDAGANIDRAALLGWAGVCAIASGAYILDRVKLTRSAMDPADNDAHADRMRFAIAHHSLLRLFAFAMLVFGSVCFWLIAGAGRSDMSDTWLRALAVLAGPASIVASMVYARGPAKSGIWRAKDVLLLKPVCVASAVVGLALLPSVLAHRIDLADWRTVGIVLCVWCWVCADAVLSDIDDVAPDARWSTHTVPTHLGVCRAAKIATIAQCAVMLALGTMLFSQIGITAHTIGWGVGFGVLCAHSTRVSIGQLRCTYIRLSVDLRLPMTAWVLVPVVVQLVSWL